MSHPTPTSPRENPSATLVSPLAAARFAGVLYVLIIVLGVWSEGVVRLSLVIDDDAVLTARNVLAEIGLFRLSVAADAVMAMADVALAVILFLLLRAVSPALALAAMVFRLVQSAIIGANLLNAQTALLLLGGGLEPTGVASAGGFSAEQLATLAALSLERHAYGYDLGLLFFGVNSLLVGYLVARSGFLPAVLGYALAAAGIVYLVGSGLRILAPGWVDAFALAYLVPLVAETAFALWLLVRGLEREAFARERSPT